MSPTGFVTINPEVVERLDITLTWGEGVYQYFSGKTTLVGWVQAVKLLRPRLSCPVQSLNMHVWYLPVGYWHVYNGELNE